MFPVAPAITFVLPLPISRVSTEEKSDVVDLLVEDGSELVVHASVVGTLQTREERISRSIMVKVVKREEWILKGES